MSAQCKQGAKDRMPLAAFFLLLLLLLLAALATAPIALVTACQTRADCANGGSCDVLAQTCSCSPQFRGASCEKELIYLEDFSLAPLGVTNNAAEPGVVGLWYAEVNDPYPSPYATIGTSQHSRGLTVAHVAQATWISPSFSLNGFQAVRMRMRGSIQSSATSTRDDARFVIKTKTDAFGSRWETLKDVSFRTGTSSFDEEVSLSPTQATRNYLRIEFFLDFRDFARVSLSEIAVTGRRSHHVFAVTLAHENFDEPSLAGVGATASMLSFAAPASDQGGPSPWSVMPAYISTPAPTSLFFGVSSAGAFLAKDLNGAMVFQLATISTRSIDNVHIQLAAGGSTNLNSHDYIAIYIRDGENGNWTNVDSRRGVYFDWDTLSCLRSCAYSCLCREKQYLSASFPSLADTLDVRIYVKVNFDEQITFSDLLIRGTRAGSQLVSSSSSSSSSVPSSTMTETTPTSTTTTMLHSTSATPTTATTTFSSSPSSSTTSSSLSGTILSSLTTGEATQSTRMPSPPSSTLTDSTHDTAASTTTTAPPSAPTQSTTAITTAGQFVQSSSRTDDRSSSATPPATPRTDTPSTVFVTSTSSTTVVATNDGSRETSGPSPASTTRASTSASASQPDPTLDASTTSLQLGSTTAAEAETVTGHRGANASATTAAPSPTTTATPFTLLMVFNYVAASPAYRMPLLSTNQLAIYVARALAVHTLSAPRFLLTQNDNATLSVQVFCGSSTNFNRLNDALRSGRIEFSVVDSSSSSSSPSAPSRLVGTYRAFVPPDVAADCAFHYSQWSACILPDNERVQYLIIDHPAQQGGRPCPVVTVRTAQCSALPSSPPAQSTPVSSTRANNNATDPAVNESQTGGQGQVAVLVIVVVTVFALLIIAFLVAMIVRLTTSKPTVPLSYTNRGFSSSADPCGSNSHGNSHGTSNSVGDSVEESIRIDVAVATFNPAYWAEENVGSPIQASPLAGHNVDAEQPEPGKSGIRLHAPHRAPVSFRPMHIKSSTGSLRNAVVDVENNAHQYQYQQPPLRSAADDSLNAVEWESNPEGSPQGSRPGSRPEPLHWDLDFLGSDDHQGTDADDEGSPPMPRHRWHECSRSSQTPMSGMSSLFDSPASSTQSSKPQSPLSSLSVSRSESRMSLSAGMRGIDCDREGQDPVTGQDSQIDMALAAPTPAAMDDVGHEDDDDDVFEDHDGDAAPFTIDFIAHMHPAEHDSQRTETSLESQTHA